MQENARSILRLPNVRSTRRLTLKGRQLSKNAKLAIERKIIELSDKRYKATKDSKGIADVLTRGNIDETLKDLRRKNWRKKLFDRQIKKGNHS